MGLNKLIEIGNIIKKYRKQLNLTQEQMATKLNIPRSTYANYENNTREANTETLFKISDVLGINVFSLIKEANTLCSNSEDVSKLKRHLPFLNVDLMKMIIEDMDNDAEFLNCNLRENDYISLLHAVKSTLKITIADLSLKNSDALKHELEIERLKSEE